MVAVGAKALKVIEFFNDLEKEYEASIHFGHTSTTYDAEGMLEKVTLKPGCTPPDEMHIRRAIAERFVGHIQQQPPSYSAVHINGQRAYDLARRGETIDMPSRSVEVTACDVISFNYPHLVLRIRCSSGTYIRSLAHDLGQLLKCGAYLEGLRRTKVGEWNVENAVQPDKVTWTDVAPLKDILKDFPRIEVDAEQAKAISMGKKIPLQIAPNTIAWFDGLPIAFLTPSKDNPQTSHARKVL